MSLERNEWLQLSPLKLLSEGDTSLHRGHREHGCHKYIKPMGAQFYLWLECRQVALEEVKKSQKQARTDMSCSWVSGAERCLSPTRLTRCC